MDPATSDESFQFFLLVHIISPLNDSPLYCVRSSTPFFFFFFVIPSQLLDLLEPGSEGVIMNIDSVPLKNYREAFEYIVDVGNKYYEEEMQGELDEDYSDPHRGEFDGYSEDWRNVGPGEDSHMTEGGRDMNLTSGISYDVNL